MDVDIFWEFFGRSVSVRKLNEAHQVFTFVIITIVFFLKLL